MAVVYVESVFQKKHFSFYGVSIQSNIYHKFLFYKYFVAVVCVVRLSGSDVQLTPAIDNGLQPKLHNFNSIHALRALFGIFINICSFAQV